MNNVTIAKSIAGAAVAPIGEGETAVGDGVDGDSVALEEVA